MDLDKTHIVVMWTVGPDEVAAGDAVFQSHGKWMEGHSRQGDTALLDYSISKGPELENPVDRTRPRRRHGIRARRVLRITGRRGRTLEAGPGNLARSAGLHGLDRQGQEGRYAAQRTDGSGPLVTAAPRFLR